MGQGARGAVKRLVGRAKSAVRAAGSGVVSAARGVFSAAKRGFLALGSAAGRVRSAVVKPVWGAVRSAARRVYSAAVQPVGAAAGWAARRVHSAVISPAWRGIKRAGSRIYSSAISPALRAARRASRRVYSAVISPALGAAARLLAGFKSALLAAVSSVCSAARRLYRGAEPYLRAALGPVATAAKRVYSAAISPALRAVMRVSRRVYSAAVQPVGAAVGWAARRVHSAVISPVWRGIKRAASVIGKTAKRLALSFAGATRNIARAAGKFFRSVGSDGWRRSFAKAGVSVRGAAAAVPHFAAKCAAVALPVAALMLVAALSPVWANFTLATEVRYDDTVLGTVADENAFALAKSGFARAVSSENAEAYMDDCSLRTVYTPKSHVLSSRALAGRMLRDTGTVTRGYGLYIAGELVAAAASPDMFYDCLRARLDAYRTPDGAGVSFLLKTEVREGYYPEEDCLTSAQVGALFAGGTLELAVKSQALVTSELETAYPEITTGTDDLYEGYSTVRSAGATGLSRVTERVTYIDGVEVRREKAGEHVVKPPVAREVLVGTRPHATYSADRAHTGDMLWPLPAGTRYTLTGDFQENRGSYLHKGVDLACPKGTPIFAAGSGTVTLSGSGGGYGMHVIIDHGNGLSTLYAHCSQLLVKAGDVVAAGQQIAAVGMTGDATGYHLHFEVRENGAVRDPFSYVG